MNNLFEFLLQEFSYKAAAEYFKEKLPLTPKSYKILSDKHKRGAFTVVQYTSAKIIAQFYNCLIDAIEEGSTMSEFREKMDSFLEDNGYEGVNPFYADNIFRTNIQTAYQVGHFEEMSKPEVKKKRPYWRYEAVGDERTRPSHLAMDGKVFPADSKIWDTWYPPNGFRCRCTVVSLSENQVKQMGLKISEHVPEAVLIRGRKIPVSIDADFAYNPAKREWRPDMGRDPESIRQAYKERMKPEMKKKISEE
ncbi:MAG: phage minor head protein [Anaerovoracaceae bacterium]